MGCLLEILFLPVDAVLQLILDGWFFSMQWIVPEKHLGKNARIILKIIIGVFCVALLTVFLIGVLAAALTEATVTDLWKLIFIPLGISLLQIMLGVIARIIARKR